LCSPKHFFRRVYQTKSKHLSKLLARKIFHEISFSAHPTLLLFLGQQNVG
jgi:hypothetical protein